MRHLNASEISAEFNNQREKFGAFAGKTGLDTAVKDLSRLIGDLQGAGLDVELTLFGDASEQAFSLFETGGLTVPVSGILRMGPIHRLVGIATKEGNQNVVKLAISEFDIRFNGVEGKLKDDSIDSVIRHKSYDLKDDNDALVKLAEEIIRHCARNDVINSNDALGVFDNGRRLQKTAPRLAPKQP
ncbi:MAG: hypothetical protein PW788_15240 [Micavibrio sp.]|nr:hypothetical protein [Micavibrio sp.]